MTTGANLTSADIGVLIMAAGFGLVGGLAQFWVARDPADAANSAVKSAIVGAVAAIGALWVQLPSPTLTLVGQSLLTGYFGRAVLALLQTRVTTALEREQKVRAIAVATDALKLAEDAAHRNGVQLEAVPAHPQITALRARLTDVVTARSLP
jgi:hypothetical protein